MKIQTDAIKTNEIWSPLTIFAISVAVSLKYTIKIYVDFQAYDGTYLGCY